MLQPYLLSIAAPRARDGLVATARIEAGATGVAVEVAEAGGAPVTLFRRPSLDFAHICWTERGDVLAFAQGCQVALLSIRGEVLALRDLAAAIRWLGARGEQLWCMSGTTLWSLDRCLEPREHADACLAADAGAGVVACIEEREARRLVRIFGTGNASFEWPLVVNQACKIRVGGGGSRVYVSAHEPAGADRVRVQMATIDLESGRAQVILDEEMALLFGGPERSLIWAPSADGAAWAVLERDGYARLWRVSARDDGASVSPEGFEILSVEAHETRPRLAVLAASIGTAAGSAESCVLASPTGLAADLRVVRRGVNRLLRWDGEGRCLYFDHGLPDTRNRIECHEAGSDRSQPETEVDPVTEKTVTADVAGAPCDVFVRAPPSGKGPAVPSGGILKVAGLHRRHCRGPQATFFHHAIDGLLQSMVARGYPQASFNGPGAPGRGSARRKLDPGRVLSATVAAAETATSSLRDAGCRRVAIVAASIGGLTALSYLDRHPECAAAVLIAPVLTADIPVLGPWRDFFGEPASRDETRRIARSLRTPLLIVHGLNDEMSPSQVTSEFLTWIPATTESHYVTLPDEGHIFRRPASWERTFVEVQAFLESHLANTQDVRHLDRSDCASPPS